jgi:beta-lactamase regulating signal transducer with metallopeptidase domain
MSDLQQLLLGNMVLAVGLAVLALVAGWMGRPALAHALWVLVLLKLLTPQVWRVPVPAPIRTTVAADVMRRPDIKAGDAAMSPALATVGRIPSPAVVDSSPASSPPSALRRLSPEQALLGLWVSGSAIWIACVLVRLGRFHRLLRLAVAVEADVQREVAQLAGRLGLSKAPRGYWLQGTLGPMVWPWLGGARLLLPRRLWESLGAEQRRTLLIHELAHLRRRDHWVRAVELLAMAVYWWNPLVWWARRELERHEEQCCDAWVVWAMPQAQRPYAEALVDTLDFLAGVGMGLPPAASGIGQLRNLEKRIVMIVGQGPPKSLSWAGWLLVAGLVAVLPLTPVWGQTPAAATTQTAATLPAASQASVRSGETLYPGGRRPNGNCSIAGKVVAEATGKPIDQCSVYLFSDDSFDALFFQPEADGSFVFKDIAPGTYSLRVINAPGYQESNYNPNGSKEQFPPFKLKPAQKLEGLLFKLKPAFCITGKVLDEAGRPLATLHDGSGPWVMAWQQQTDPERPKFMIASQSQVFADGYTLDGLDGSPVYVMAIDDMAWKHDGAYPPSYYPGVFSRASAQLIHFGNGRKVTGIDIHLRKTGGLVLQGQVTDKTTGKPIPDAMIVVQHADVLFDSVFAYTGQDGRYRFECLGEGNCSVNVDATPTGFVRYRKTITLAAGAASAKLDFALAPGASIRGKFVRADGTPARIVPEVALGGAQVGKPDYQGPTYSNSGTHHRHDPDSVGQHGCCWWPGEGPYNDTAMFFPTADSFMLLGVMPGKAILYFNPMTPGERVARMLLNGKRLPGWQLDVTAGQTIDGVTIELQDQAAGTAGHK